MINKKNGINVQNGSSDLNDRSNASDNIHKNPDQNIGDCSAADGTCLNGGLTFLCSTHYSYGYKLNVSVSEDTVFDFMKEVIPKFTVDAIPNGYLFALYKIWMEIYHPDCTDMIGKNTLIARVKELIVNFPDWYFPPSHFRVNKYLDKQEETLCLYDIKEWMMDPDSMYDTIRYRLKHRLNPSEEPLNRFIDGMLRTKFKKNVKGA